MNMKTDNAFMYLTYRSKVTTEIEVMESEIMWRQNLLYHDGHFQATTQYARKWLVYQPIFLLSCLLCSSFLCLSVAPLCTEKKKPLLSFSLWPFSDNDGQFRALTQVRVNTSAKVNGVKLIWNPRMKANAVIRQYSSVTFFCTVSWLARGRLKCREAAKYLILPFQKGENWSIRTIIFF